MSAATEMYQKQFWFAEKGKRVAIKSLDYFFIYYLWLARQLPHVSGTQHLERLCAELDAVEAAAYARAVKRSTGDVPEQS